jgi:HTH-type transcriptional regulator/antitoxin HigA
MDELKRQASTEPPVQSTRAQAIQRAWLAFKEALGITSVRNEDDYTRARATIELLLDEVGDDEQHPLAEVLDYLADRIAAWEDEQVRIPDAEPKEVLRFLMEQHGLKQEDLADCAPQGRISDILSGRRAVSKEVARRLARRFNVSVAVFV